MAPRVNGLAAIDEVLQKEFRTLAAARELLPLLVDWGVEDFSETVHSVGINYLAVVGRCSGRVAVSEFPIRLQNLADSASPGWVIPDVVWWERETHQPSLIGEFERYEPGGAKRQVLQEKARNLLLAHREVGNGARVLLLMLWTLSGTPVRGLEEFRSLIRNGFRMLGGAGVPGLEPESRFVIATAVFTSFEGRLRLREILA